jgi:predicted DNA-binding transcriptional regulator YafY
MRADRLLSILLLLQTKGRLTAADLAHRLEVSERTIYRDLDALSAAGIPVYAERGPNGGLILDEGYRTDLTGLTESEAASLMASRAADPLADLGLGRSLEGAILKLAASLPRLQREGVERIRQRLHLDSAGWFQFEEPVPHLRTVQEALWQERRLRILYRRSDGGWVKRLVEPYGLAAKAGIWYLVGMALHKTIVYRVSRIQEAELTDGRFTYPPDFNLAAFWQEWSTQFQANLGHYEATLRVAPDSTPALQTAFGERVHDLLANAGRPDDQGWCTIRVPFQNFDQARSLIMGLGTKVIVLEPTALRHAILEQATHILAFYQTPPRDSQ